LLNIPAAICRVEPLEKSLDAYIEAPQGLVPGTTMPFAGIPNSGGRADLIAYLETLK